MKSLDERVQLFVETGWEKSATSLAQWTDAQKEVASYKNKAMNAIFNVVSLEEIKKISNVEVAHTAWNILQTMLEGTKAVKINKLQWLTSKFKSIKMFEDESFDEFYAKLNDIVNLAFNWGEVCEKAKIEKS